MEKPEKEGTDPRRVILLSAAVAALTVAAHMATATEARGACLLSVVLAMQLSGLVPLYCIGLLVPVLATVMRTMPGNAESTARACFAAMMNPMTALVLGSFTVQAICLKCRLEVRFMARVATQFGDRPRLFLLLLMLGCMLCSAVTMITLLALAAVRPVAMRARGGGGISLLLGVGIACTLGGVLTPIAGTPALILLSVLQEYGTSVAFLDWVLVALPTQTCVCVAAWAVLLAVFGTPPKVSAEDMGLDTPPALGEKERVFLGLVVLFLVGCICEPQLRPVVGDNGNLGLLLCACSFIAYLDKADFLALPWDVLALLFGVNTLSLVLKNSGLARVLAQAVVPAQIYGDLSLWMEVLKLTACAACVSSIAPHAVVATIGLPVVVALGFQLYAPVLVSLLVVQAVGCSVGTPYSSIDLLMTVEVVEETPRAEGEPPIAERRDFVRGGVAVTVAGWAVVCTVGYVMAHAVLGTPPQHIIRHQPSELQPSIEAWSEESATEARLRDLEARIADEYGSGGGGGGGSVSSDDTSWGDTMHSLVGQTWGTAETHALVAPEGVRRQAHAAVEPVAPVALRSGGPHLRLHPRLLNSYRR